MAVDQNGYVAITLRDVYESVQAVQESLSKLHGAASALSDHETRLRAVERRVWALPSVATVLAIGSIIATIMVSR